MRGNKENKPLSFGLFGGRKSSRALLAFVIVLAIGIFTQIIGAVYLELKDRKERPALALKSILRDVRDFVRIEKRIPADFAEIEDKIWNKGKKGTVSVLHGKSIYTADNYEYIYFAGKTKEIPLVNIWAIPLGKYRDQYDSVLLVITPDGEESWRGPALTNAQHDFVLENGFNPTFPQMAMLNMKKDAVSGPKEKGKFGF